MFNYTIDWLKFIVSNIAIDLRQRIHIVWLWVSFAGIRELHDRLLQFRLDTLYDAGINGQVVKLERMLNDTFDNSLRRIYIDDGERFEGANFYSFYLDKSFSFFSHNHDEVVSIYSFGSQGDAVDTDFIVFVPSGLVYDTVLMTAKVKAKKILGRSFTIQEY